MINNNIKLQPNFEREISKRNLLLKSNNTSINITTENSEYKEKNIELR